MLKNRQLIYKNVKNKRVRHGLIYGSNPNRATRWCDQPTGPTLNITHRNLTGNNGRYVNYNFGFWGDANANKYFRNSTQMGCYDSSTK